MFALEVWAKEYRGDLGIALSDVYGMDAFLRDFDMYFCKLFDGARHDSGDPFVWGERLLEHYRANRADPRAKTLVFSDSLTFPRAIELARQFTFSRCKVSFGIGTNLTNDLGPRAPADRHEDDALQWAAGRQGIGCARRRTMMRRSRLSGLPPPGVPASRRPEGRAVFQPIQSMHQGVICRH